MEITNLKKSKKSQVIKKAVQVLESGGILIYPTETCYGAGVDATNQQAVDRVLKFKSRREGKPLSIAVCDQKMASDYCRLNSTARSIFQNFLPGPVTVVSNGLHQVAKGVESEQGTVGIRIPDYDLILEIIRQFGRPITATSANLSGAKTPYSVDDIFNNISDQRRQLIDLVIDTGQLPKRPPSTVVDTMMEDYHIIRQGEIKVKQKENSSKFISNSAEETQKIAKDYLLSHISALKQKCLIFALEGDLGSGKTQFAKGLAQALQIKELVISPTFSLVRQYQIPSSPSHSQPSLPSLPSVSFSFYHLDTWRLLDPKELDDLGIEQMIKPGNIIAIEWAEKLATGCWRLAAGDWQIIQVKFEHKSENQRLIYISSLSSLPSLSS